MFATLKERGLLGGRARIDRREQDRKGDFRLEFRVGRRDRAQERESHFSKVRCVPGELLFFLSTLILGALSIGWSHLGFCLLLGLAAPGSVR